MSASGGTYLWWLAGRSAGIVAMVMVTASVLLGLGMAARVIPRKRRRGASEAHEHVALVALGAIAAHGLFLLFDPTLKAGIAGIMVPGSLTYRPLWTSLGIVAGYLAVLLGLSYYVRRRVGPRLWRKLHRLMIVVYALALAHTLGSGTDAAIPAFRYAMLASAVPVVALFALRFTRPRRPVRKAAVRPIGCTQVAGARAAEVAETG